jgi:apolipoprotein N-acyltransferase
MTLGKLGFPWGRAALSQVGLLYSVQTVSLFGSYFLVVILVCSCMMFALALKKRKRLYAYIGCSIILANLITGTILYYIPTQTRKKIQKASRLESFRKRRFERKVGSREAAGNFGTVYLDGVSGGRERSKDYRPAGERYSD